MRRSSRANALCLAFTSLAALTASAAHAYPPGDPCHGLESATDHKASGKGTSFRPYRLCTAAQLASLGASPADWGKVYILESDLDMTGYDAASYTPPGNSTTSFSGVFDGQGHAILNLSRVGTGVGNGVFGQVSGVVRDLTVAGFSLQGSSVGGAVGYLRPGGLVEDVHVRDGVLTGAPIGGTGGVVGFLSGATVRRCSAVDVVITANVSGGLVGDAVGASLIEDSYASADVGGGSALGGLVGRMTNGTIRRSYATGSVTGTSYAVGGLIGSCYTTNITDAFATGDVAGLDTSFIKRVGLFAGLKSSCSGSGNVYDTAASCVVTSGGVCMSTMVGLTGVSTTTFPDYFQLTTNAPMTTWSFLTTWVAVVGATPTLVGAP